MIRPAVAVLATAVVLLTSVCRPGIAAPGTRVVDDTAHAAHLPEGSLTMDQQPAGRPGTRTEHRQLVEAAARCQQHRARFSGDDPGHRRAREMLTGMADYCRAAATVFDLDPTLADEPHDTGRFRAIDLLAELARHLQHLVGQAVSDTFLDRWPTQDRWDEAEALYERAGQLAGAIPAVVPRRDHNTVAGAQAISRARLTARYSDVANAADTIRSAIAAALRLPHPTPHALELADLADQLERHAGNLQALHDAEPDAFTAVLRACR